MYLKELKDKNPAPNFAKKTKAEASPQERPIRPRPPRALSQFLRKNKSNLDILRQDWYGARILILGFGKEGKDSYLALRRLFPDKVLGIADKRNLKSQIFPKQSLRNATGQAKLNSKTSDVKLHFGKNYLESIKNYDVIIRTPGIPLRIIKSRLEKRQRITSQAEIFLRNCPGTIIGITGTKGKGTTASLIYKILKQASLSSFPCPPARPSARPPARPGFANKDKVNRVRVKLIGNIGKPVFQILLKSKKTDIYVYELSSHQLEDLKVSPHIAVFLNLYPCHLDHFLSFKNYQKAKENIAVWQRDKDFFIYNNEQKELRELAKKTKAKKIPIFASPNKIKKNLGFLNFKKLPLRGRHNLFDIAIAIEAVKLFKIPDKIIKQAIESFQPMPHRLEFIGEYNGIKFFNDSLATVPEAVIVGLDAFKDKIGALILGGQKIKGIDFSGLARTIIRHKIKNLILFPETGKEIYQEIKKQNSKFNSKFFFVDSMKDAVKIVYQNTRSNKICLLSPGAPSFNLFKDYRHRGNLFKRYVRGLRREM